ncbi:MAG: hypothetical protein ABL934_14785 [Lysobacteraceae bacterium]
MNNNTDRVLGRVLAVEETRDVSGARPIISTIVDMDDVETSPQADISVPSSEQSIPANETTVFDDTGTVADTGVALDCSVSTTRLDIISADPDC